jgi:hypothetical protein
MSHEREDGLSQDAQRHLENAKHHPEHDPELPPAHRAADFDEINDDLE